MPPAWRGICYFRVKNARKGLKKTVVYAIIGVYARRGSQPSLAPPSGIGNVLTLSPSSKSGLPHPHGEAHPLSLEKGSPWAQGTLARSA